MENNKIFKQQENLHAVNISEAWQELSSIDPSIKYGDSSLVYPSPKRTVRKG